MPINISDVRDKYFYVFADCRLTRGYTRTLICDTSRKMIYFIDNSYFELLSELKSSSIGEVADMLETDDDHIQFEIFINYLLKIEIGEIVDDIALFPDIEEIWDHPSPITNAIIDIRNEFHDFQDILVQLNDMYCEYLQVRSYSVLPHDKLLNILFNAAGKNFRSLTIIMPYDELVHSVESMDEILKEFRFVRFYIYNTPEKAFVHHSTQKDKIEYTQQHITSCDACGIINKESFFIPSIQGYMENTLFNGCLNRKISIDEDGNIKNCPSMENSFGNITNTLLSSVVEATSFKKIWSVNKSSISICSDCEYRAVCTDCRAYTQDPLNPYSKPLKCNYDPYLGAWQKKNTPALRDLNATANRIS